ncbi:hypothetical protein DJ73_14640 [Halorubrum sp. Ea1]|nr:hypothetical protein DJ73_14640 [Halorubrum sp. Ea1]
MQSAVLLRCPMCNAIHALEGQRNEYSKQDLYSRVKTHLRGHNLNEPKMAIRKYGIVSDAVEVVVSSENRHQLPIEAWQKRDDTWLPDGVLSDGDTSPTASESSVEVSSH